MAWRLAGTGLLLLTVILTLAYFRPSIINLVVYHGAGRTKDVLAADAKMWVALNWLRIGVVLASLSMGLRALTVAQEKDEQNRNLVQEKGKEIEALKIQLQTLEERTSRK